MSVGNAGEWEESYGMIDVGAVFGMLTCGKQLNFPSRLQIRRHLRSFLPIFSVIWLNLAFTWRHVCRKHQNGLPEFGAAFTDNKTSFVKVIWSDNDW